MAATDSSATFKIVADDGLSGVAASAAEALKNLQTQLDKDTAALTGMNKALRNLKGGASVSTDQIAALEKAIAAKKDSIAQSQLEYMKLGGSFTKATKDSGGFRERIEQLTDKLKDVKRPANDNSTALEKISKVAHDMPGPLGSIVSRFESLTKVFRTGALRGGIVAVTAALVALVAIMGVAVLALTRYAIAQANARRNEMLRLQGLTKLRTLLPVVAGNARQMQQQIDAVVASTGVARDQAADMTEKLYRMGVRGQAMGDILQAASMKAQVHGQAAADAFMSWAGTIAMAGGNVRRFTDDVRARLGGIVEQQMLSLESITQQLSNSWYMLFTGIRIDPFLRGLRSVTQLFSQSTNSGRALKALVETLVQPLIDKMTSAFPVVKRFFQGAILQALALGIAFYRIRNAIYNALGWDPTQGPGKQMDLLNAALITGKVVVYALALAFAVLAAWVIASTYPLLIFIAMMWGAYKIIVKFADYVQKYGWKALGESIWKGIIDGLLPGGEMLSDTLTGGIDQAWANYKQHWKDTFGLGGGAKLPGGPHTIDLPTQQITGDADDSGGAAPAVAAAAPPGAKHVTVTIGDVNIMPPKGGDAQDFGNAFRDQLADVLEGVATQMGRMPAHG